MILKLIERLKRACWKSIWKRRFAIISPTRFTAATCTAVKLIQLHLY